MRDVTIANMEMAGWIARLGSFTAAAERLNTTQPAISARVRDLEEALGIRLFDRHARGVQPTPEGRRFLDSTEPLLRQLEELAFSASRSSAAGVIRLGTSSIPLGLVARLACASRAAFPNISYEVTIDRAAMLLDGVESRQLDLAIVSGPVDAFRFASRGLGIDEMLWVTSPALLAAHPDRATLYREAPVWCIGHDSFYWETAVRSLNESGVEVGRVNELSHGVALARIVVEGGGVGLLSRSAVAGALASGELVAVPGLPPCAEIAFRIVSLKQEAERSVIVEIMRIAVEVSDLARPSGAN